MAKRTISQVIGEVGENLVCSIVDAHPSWIARKQDKDFGVDIEMELAIPAKAAQDLAGKLIKVQVKASEHVSIVNEGISVSVDREYLDYVVQFRIPVVLVAVDITSKRAWFVWLQAWMLENEERLATQRVKSVVVVIPQDRDLEAGLNCYLQSVARGEEAASFVLALRELFNAAIATLNLPVFEGTLRLLSKIDGPSRGWIIQSTTDKLIGFGPHVGYSQASRILYPLLSLIDQVGNLLTREQVIRLVIREENYSRTGVNALSRLYDRWPGHAQSLGLSELFRQSRLKEVAWYCDLREHYPEIESLTLIDALTNRKLPKTCFGGLNFPEDPGILRELPNKWANRGDSAFLEYLFWDEGSLFPNDV